MLSVGNDVSKKITGELLITHRRNFSIGKTVKFCIGRGLGPTRESSQPQCNPHYFYSFIVFSLLISFFFILQSPLLIMADKMLNNHNWLDYIFTEGVSRYKHRIVIGKRI